MTATLVLPNGREIARPCWWMDQHEVDDRQRTLRGLFFLVRIAGNDGVGEVWRCRRCGGRHTYMTASCIERPFNGLDGAVMAIYQQAGDLVAARSLTPGRGGAHAAARLLVRRVMDLPDLATAHPMLARQRADAQHLSQFDVHIGAIRLGRVEQIPRTLAQRYLDRINANRPAAGRLHVEGLTS